MLAQTNILHMLPKIKVPTMVVAGKHDTVRPPAGTEELAKKIPGARFELIEEAGHFMPTTGPKTLLKLLKDFLPKMGLFPAWPEAKQDRAPHPSIRLRDER